MKVLQMRERVTEDDVWNAIVRPEFPGRVSADYVFGRMMKLYIDFGPDFVAVRNGDCPPRSDYQSWCHKYGIYETLIQGRSGVPEMNVTRTMSAETEKLVEKYVNARIDWSWAGAEIPVDNKKHEKRVLRTWEALDAHLAALEKLAAASGEEPEPQNCAEIRRFKGEK